MTWLWNQDNFIKNKFKKNLKKKINKKNIVVMNNIW